jgi:hypothetical protein
MIKARINTPRITTQTTRIKGCRISIYCARGCPPFEGTKNIANVGFSCAHPQYMPSCAANAASARRDRSVAELGCVFYSVRFQKRRNCARQNRRATGQIINRAQNGGGKWRADDQTAAQDEIGYARFDNDMESIVLAALYRQPSTAPPSSR